MSQQAIKAKPPSASEQQQPVPQTMEAFLADIEKRAYRMVDFAVHGHADAIDLLQDSMIKLVTNYSDKAPHAVSYTHLTLPTTSRV